MEESKDCYVEKEKEENIWRRSLQKLSRILRSLGFGLGLETFADSIWRVSISVSENLVSEKSLSFGKIFLQKKSRFWSQKTWFRKRKNENNKKETRPSKQCKSLI